MNNENLDYKELENWLIDEMRFSPSTVHATTRKLKYVADRCDMTREGLQNFIRKVWNSQGNKTANGYITIINRFLKFNRMKPFKYFKEYESFVIKLCTEEQEKRLLDIAKMVGKRESAMFYLLFGTGVRLHEACDLKLTDIMEDRIIVKGKGQKVREIFLPLESKDAINEYLTVRSPSDKDYLFTTNKGKMSYDYFRKRCEIVSLKAGIKFHPHMARHTYATKLIKENVDIYYVSRLLGHEDLSSTQIYLHASQDDAINEARKVRFFLEVQDQDNLDVMDWLGFEPRASSMPRRRSTS